MGHYVTVRDIFIYTSETRLKHDKLNTLIDEKSGSFWGDEVGNRHASRHYGAICCLRVPTFRPTPFRPKLFVQSC